MLWLCTDIMGLLSSILLYIVEYEHLCQWPEWPELIWRLFFILSNPYIKKFAMYALYAIVLVFIGILIACLLLLMFLHVLWCLCLLSLSGLYPREIMMSCIYGVVTCCYVWIMIRVHEVITLVVDMINTSVLYLIWNNIPWRTDKTLYWTILVYSMFFLLLTSYRGSSVITS